MTTSSADPCEIQVRRASDADLDSISGLIRRAYARYADRMERPPAPVLRDYLAETQAGQVWVAEEPIAGVIVLVSNPESLLVENVAVDPAAQGTGLGRRLMEFAEQQALAAGLRRLTLYTNEVMTENLAIYRRLGYREVDRRLEDGYRRVFLEKVL
jgi:ribosomal protein S18 acetylase RimI-like enzyme